MIDKFFLLPEWIRYVIAGTTMFWGILIACFGYVYAAAIRDSRREFMKKSKKERKRIIDEGIGNAINSSIEKVIDSLE